MKQCKVCLQGKELIEFSKEPKTRDGHRNQCIKCRDEMRKIRRDKNREVWNAYMREYRKEHSGSRKWRDKQKDRSLKHRYGISLAERDEMFLRQGGKCLICQKTEEQVRTKLGIDHCHKTKKIRGLLCSRCNYYIGYIKESPEVIRRLLSYLGA